MSILVSLLPATLTSHEPITVATPVRTSPSPIIKRAAIRITLGSLNPEKASESDSVPLSTNATITSSATASMRTLPVAKRIMAIASRLSTQINSPFTTCPCQGGKGEILPQKGPNTVGPIHEITFSRRRSHFRLNSCGLQEFPAKRSRSRPRPAGVNRSAH
ncbi:hypothetical protein D3C80_1024390 [compost metagenome]